MTDDLEHEMRRLGRAQQIEDQKIRRSEDQKIRREYHHFT